jgi:hypothetical protein
MACFAKQVRILPTGSTVLDLSFDIELHITLIVAPTSLISRFEYRARGKLELTVDDWKMFRKSENSTGRIERPRFSRLFYDAPCCSSIKNLEPILSRTQSDILAISLCDLHTIDSGLDRDQVDWIFPTEKRRYRCHWSLIEIEMFSEGTIVPRNLYVCLRKTKMMLK